MFFGEVSWKGKFEIFIMVCVVYRMDGEIFVYYWDLEIIIFVMSKVILWDKLDYIYVCLVISICICSIFLKGFYWLNCVFYLIWLISMNKLIVDKCVY